METSNLRVSIKKVIVFEQPRKNEEGSNPNRETFGAIVFNNPVGYNRPTTAVNLTRKEFDMLCTDIDIKGRDQSGAMVGKGVPAWNALKQFVNRYDGATADVEVRELNEGDTFVNYLKEETRVVDPMTIVRVNMIHLPHSVSDRLRTEERNWGSVVTSTPDWRKFVTEGSETNNTPE